MGMEDVGNPAGFFDDRSFMRTIHRGVTDKKMEWPNDVPHHG